MLRVQGTAGMLQNLQAEGGPNSKTVQGETTERKQLEWRNSPITKALPGTSR
jgi:hypothetical protein